MIAQENLQKEMTFLFKCGENLEPALKKYETGTPGWCPVL